jgi:hypothetical protein
VETDCDCEESDVGLVIWRERFDWRVRSLAGVLDWFFWTWPSSDLAVAF